MRIALVDISEAEFQIMHAAVLRMLSEYGLLIELPDAVEMLEKRGNRVGDDGRVHLTPDFVESMLALVPKEGFTMYGRDGTHPLKVAVDEMAFRPSTGAPFVYDYARQGRREATMQDAEMFIRLVDSLDGYGMVNPVVTPANAPAGLENVILFAQSHRFSLKPSDVTVMTRREVNMIARIAAAIRGGEKELRDMPLTAVDVAMITPLRCAGEQVEAMLECAEWGIPVEVLTSPAMGMTSPLTIAGSTVVSVAEMIGALCIIYCVSPGLGIINTSRISPTNMRTTAYNYGAPELGMGSVLVASCCARYGIPCNLYGFGTAAKVPGDQAQMEKMLAGTLIALGRPHMITGSGVLDSAMVTSLEQLVIDDEAVRFLGRVRQPVEISEESIGYDALVSGMASSGCLLAEDHTLEQLHRGEMIDCGLGQWDSFSDWEKAGSPELLDRAHARVEELLENHSVPAFDNELEQKISEIICM